MEPALVGPAGVCTQRAHHVGGPLDMLFSLGAIHVQFPDVAKIMQEKAEPQSRVPREAVQPPPRPRDEPRMHGKLVRAEEHTPGSYGHRGGSGTPLCVGRESRKACTSLVPMSTPGASWYRS